jgi:phytoene dehydrogenase-like protein
MVNRGPGYDVVVVGAGHNGLVAAGYLARAGLRVVVLEARREPGGALLLANTVGRLRASVIQDLGLARHGLSFIRPRVRAFAPQPDGRAVTLWGDVARTAEELRMWSPRDAEAYAGFDRKVRSVASFLAHLFATTPPDIQAPSWHDAMAGLRLGRAIRGLGSPAHAREVLRILPMPVADLVGEVFESDAVRSVLATRGVRYAAMGPWSSGTAAVLLGDSAGNGGGAAGETVFARGGPVALASALASAVRSSGGEIRTGAEVGAIRSRDGRVTGVALISGEELDASIVVSGVDPRRTLVDLIDPVAIGPTLRWRAQNLRLRGTAGRVELLLSNLPRFSSVVGVEGVERLGGRIVIAPGIDHLERAFDASKYGRVSDAPYLDAVIPTLAEPGMGQDGRHRMSVVVQWTPYHLRDADWNAEREGLGDLVTKTLEEYAPGISDLVIERTVVTPLDLERDYGLTEGHPLHGEPGLDQFFLWRPLLGHARYRMPVAGLYLCGSGAHPGGGITGAPGANAAREILVDLGPGRRR